MSKQLTLFGTIAREKSNKYICYKNPTGNYECFVERFSLRRRELNPNKRKKILVEEAQEAWKKLAKDIAAQEEYLKLRKGEKEFVRYKNHVSLSLSVLALVVRFLRSTFACFIFYKNTENLI